MMLEMRWQECQANFHFTHFIQESACARFLGINCFFKFLPRGGGVETSHNEKKRVPKSPFRIGLKKIS